MISRLTNNIFTKLKNKKCNKLNKIIANYPRAPQLTFWSPIIMRYRKVGIIDSVEPKNVNTDKILNLRSKLTSMKFPNGVRNSMKQEELDNNNTDQNDYSYSIKFWENCKETNICHDSNFSLKKKIK